MLVFDDSKYIAFSIVQMSNECITVTSRKPKRVVALALSI